MSQIVDVNPDVRIRLGRRVTSLGYARCDYFEPKPAWRQQRTLASCLLSDVQNRAISVTTGLRL